MFTMTITADTNDASVHATIRGWHVIAGMLAAFAIESTERDKAKHSLALVNQIFLRAGRKYRGPDIPMDGPETIRIPFAREDFPRLAEAILALVSVNPGCYARVIKGPRFTIQDVGSWQATSWLRACVEDYEDAFKESGT